MDTYEAGVVLSGWEVKSLRMGKAGRKRVLESYSWSQHNLELEGYIKRMVKNND